MDMGMEMPWQQEQMGMEMPWQQEQMGMEMPWQDQMDMGMEMPWQQEQMEESPMEEYSPYQNYPRHNSGTRRKSNMSPSYYPSKRKY